MGNLSKSQQLRESLDSGRISEVLPYLSPEQRQELDDLLIELDVVTWLEHHFIIPEPRDPVTGELLADEGPIKIAPYQARVLREALKKNPDGTFKYATILWSETKKAGKTTIAAGVLTWLAWTTQNAECYCVANDGKQSKDKIYAKIRKAVMLSRKRKGILGKAHDTRDRVTFPHGSFIEAIACDPSGEAGGEPTMTVFSELHGMRQEHKRRLWAEMTVPPTRWGRAIRWAESYAGYKGEGSVLEDLYEKHIENGVPHPDFPDLPVYAQGKTLALWNTTGRQVWHTAEYLAHQAQDLTDNEFRRLHKNEWVSPITDFIPAAWWNACVGNVPPIGDIPIIVAADAAVSGDCFAIVAVSRHPDESKADECIAVRYCQIWKPPPGGKIDFLGTEDDPGPELVIERLINDYNVTQLCYDSYQLHDMATRLRRKGLVWIKEFGQVRERLESDNQLRQLILHRRILHDGNSPDLAKHISNAAAKIDSEEGRLRIVKQSDRLHIDAAVALSMAAYRCLKLNL